MMNTYQMYTIVVYIWLSLITNEVEYLFHLFIGNLRFLFHERPIHSFILFFYGSVSLLLFLIFIKW